MGAQERFEELYRRHAGAVRAYALRRTETEAADDVVADVFVVAWRRLDDVPVEVAEARPSPSSSKMYSARRWPRSHVTMTSARC